jgi:hypothetical protein
MSIPSSQVTDIEIQVRGVIASAGSSAKATNFSFHYKRYATVFPVDHVHINTAFQAAVAVKIGLALNHRWTQSLNTVRFVNDALDAPVFVNEAVVGAIAGDSMATHLTVYMLLKTGIKGKSYRGSKHFAPCSEADTTTGGDDILNAAAIITFGNLAAAILAGFTDSDGNVWVPSVLSRFLSQLKTNPTTVVSNQVTAVLVNKRLGRMKRRMVASVY